MEEEERERERFADKMANGVLFVFSFGDGVVGSVKVFFKKSQQNYIYIYIYMMGEQN